MRENLMCPAHKGTNENFRSNFDSIFGGVCECSPGVVRCDRCDRFMMDGDDVCASCRHIELLESGERELGDFKGGDAE
jgi:hypothetical protein